MISSGNDKIGKIYVGNDLIYTAKQPIQQLYLIEIGNVTTTSTIKIPIKTKASDTAYLIEIGNVTTTST